LVAKFHESPELLPLKLTEFPFAKIESFVFGVFGAIYLNVNTTESPEGNFGVVCVSSPEIFCNPVPPVNNTPVCTAILVPAATKGPPFILSLYVAVSPAFTVEGPKIWGVTPTVGDGLWQVHPSPFFLVLPVIPVEKPDKET